MGVFAALDVSQNETAACVVDAGGTILAEGKSPTCPDAIAAWLSRWGDEVETVGMETGPLAVWLWNALTSRAVPGVCIDARHANGVPKMTRRIGGSRLRDWAQAIAERTGPRQARVALARKPEGKPRNAELVAEIRPITDVFAGYGYRRVGAEFRHRVRRAVRRREGPPGPPHRRQHQEGAAADAGARPEPAAAPADAGLRVPLRPRILVRLRVAPRPAEAKRLRRLHGPSRHPVRQPAGRVLHEDAEGGRCLHSASKEVSPAAFEDRNARRPVDNPERSGPAAGAHFGTGSRLRADRQRATGARRCGAAGHD